MTDIDDLWASLQADDAAQRNKSKKKEKKISSAKAKALKEVPAAKPKEVATETASVNDKEVTPENAAQHMHFHIRSVISGNLGQRKESLRFIARCVYHTQCCVSCVHSLSVAEPPLAPSVSDDPLPSRLCEDGPTAKAVVESSWAELKAVVFEALTDSNSSCRETAGVILTR